MLAYKEFEIKKAFQQKSLHLGRIGQSDFAIINRIAVHETRKDAEKLRVYDIPDNALQLGLNYLVIRIEDNKGSGGLLGPVEEMYLQLDNERIPLNGDWKYYIRQNNSRGINHSDFSSGKNLAAKFVAYNPKGQTEKIIGRKGISDPNAIRLQLRAIKNEMRYDQSELVVTAGKPVEISFENTDFLQHNLLIVAPGSLEKVGSSADEMAQRPDGMEKQYIPEIPQVLHASDLVDPGQTFVLRFAAPQEPGEYPFVCTFPGHWRTMNGVLKVVGVI